MHTVQVTPIIGLPQFNGWSQVATNASGTLVCAFSVAGLNAGNVGRDLVETISSLQVITAAELHDAVSEWIDEIEAKGCQLELATALIQEGSALFAAYRGQILLKRDQKVGNLLKSETDLKIIQGKSSVEDIYVLATNHAVSFLGEIQQKLMQGYDLDTIVTSVVPAMHGSPDSSLSSLGFGTIVDSQTISRSLDDELISDEVLMTNESVPLSPLTSTPVIDPELQSMTSSTISPTMGSMPSSPAGISPTLELPAAATTPSASPKPQPTTTADHLLARLGKAVLELVRRVGRSPSRLGSKDVYVSERSPKKMLMILAVVTGLALLATGGMWWWRRNQTLQVQAVEAAVAPFEQRIAQAQANVASNPVASRDEMAKAIQEMEALVPQFQDQPAAQEKLREHLDRVKATYQQVSGREELQELQIFYDFSLIQGDFVATRADTNQTQAVFADAGKRQLIWLDLTNKQVRKLSDYPKEALTDLVIGDETVIVLGKGMERLSLTSETAQFETLKEEGDSNREATLVGFFSDYIYALNPPKRNVYRYAPEDEGEEYSDPIGWIKPGKSLPYDQVSSWSIDGDIWFGTKDGKIYKFSSGEGSAFTPQGLPEAFAHPLIVYTRENLQYLYVLEPDSQRLVILAKTGEFIRQVKSPSLASATALIVSEEIAKALAISGSIVFEVPL